MRSLSVASTALILSALALLTPDVLAQGQEQSVGFGQFKRSFNVSELAGTRTDTLKDTTILGVAAWDGLLYVSGRNGGSTSDHKIYIIDTATTTLMGQYTIPEPHASSSAGIRDMATDLVGNLITAGDEGIAVMNRAGDMLDSVMTAAGPVKLPLDMDGFPVAGNQGGALDSIHGTEHRFAGVAFDPVGDGGNGSFYVGNLQNSGAWYELRISDAAIVREFFASEHDTTGLAIDPVTGSLWTSAENDGAGRGIFEMDLLGAVDSDADGVIEILGTGRGFSTPESTSQGGLDFMAGGDRGHPWGAAWDLVSTARNEPGLDDSVIFNRLHQFPGVAGYQESLLLGSAGANPIADSFPVLYGEGSQLNWGVVNNGRPNTGGPVAIVINFGSDAAVDGINLLPNGMSFPELVAISFLSNPAPVVGEVIQSTNIDATTSVTLPAGFAVSTGDLIRMQAVYFEPASPTLGVGASNEMWFSGVNIKEVLVELEGPNTFYVDLVNPFFRVTEMSGDPSKAITKVIIDFSSASLLEGNNYIDSDEYGMFDYFAAGNGGVYGCAGTYRNSSDITTGLIYAGTDQIPQVGPVSSDFPACFGFLAPVDGMGNPIAPQSGFLGSNRFIGSRNPRTVEFNFTPGMFVGTTFGFDADMDGDLNGAGGNAYAGALVTIERADGSSFMGHLFPDSDPAHPDRSLIGW